METRGGGGVEAWVQRRRNERSEDERMREGEDRKKTEDCRRLNHFNRGNTEKKRRAFPYDLHPGKTRCKAQGKQNAGQTNAMKG